MSVSTSNIITNCKNCPHRPLLFEKLSDEDLNTISNNRIIVRYKPNETVIKQNSPATQSFCLKSGLAKVYIEGSDEKNIIIKYIKPSDFTGITGFYTENRYKFSVQTIEDCFFCFIDYQTINKIISTNIDFSNKINSILSNNLGSFYERIINLTQKQMPGRVALALLYLYESVFNDYDFDIRISRQELSELTSMTKDSAGRMIKEFNEEGIIESKGKFIKILKLNRLKQISRHG